MNIEIISEPILLDFIKVVARMPEDQREHFTAMTGHPFDVDSLAIGNYTVQGPKWCVKIDGVPVAVGGFAFQRPGVFRDFFISTPEAFEGRTWFYITRICRRVMDAMLVSGVHRLECIVPAARVAARPELAKWYKILGYNKEGLHYGYCADGTDAVSYARVKH